MDFSALLSEARKNESGKQAIACYQTKFTPPKKQTKERKTLSENIKKFIERKQEEERQKRLEEERKRENLLALRDHKAQSRINKHLKVCKAANKSVLADAVDNENTAVTIAGPSQPDEDDYGYVSQAVAALHDQFMNKYSSTPQKSIFSASGKKTIKDISTTKDRVKQALKQQEVEEALGHRRKRKSTTKEPQDHEEKPEKESERNAEQERDPEKPRPKKKPAPPPMDFRELLKIAEKKQHEPVVIEAKPKNEEPERLMTKKQMKEYEKEKEWRERREQRERNEQTNKNPTKLPTKSPAIPKIPKIERQNSIPKPQNVTAKPASGPPRKPDAVPKAKLKSERDKILEEKRKLEDEKRKLEKVRQEIEEEKKKLALSKSKQEEKLPQKPMDKAKTKVPERQLVKEKPRAPGVAKPREPVPNGKPKQFPPPDLKPLKPKLSKDSKRPLVNKRRIYDDDEEYDSELDDFIDDGVEDETADYSKYISEIFGYDKSKYRYVDDEDDAGMESSFAQQLKEEHVSTKIGIMEDLEDMRKEALEKERRASIKKKMKK